MNTKQLQQALYTRLNSQVGGSVVGIYTDVPQADDSELDSAYPFITIGPFVGSNDDTKDDNGVDVVAHVHIWSRSTSALTWRELHDDVFDALQDYRSLPVTGANVVNLLYEGSEDFPDPDGKTTHVVMRFRVSYFLT